MNAELHGYVARGFERVRDTFAHNIEQYDVGAGFALYVGGRKVVDLSGGRWHDGRPYDADTIQLVFSTTKGATAACANLLADRRLLDVDAPVTHYWPEFGQSGKKDVLVRWLLCHKAGLPVIDRRLRLEEVLAGRPVVEALEVQSPLWEPGTAHGYHALTYGWLVGEVLRRIDGRTLGTFFQEELARPLGLEFWIGSPPEVEDRVAPLRGYDLTAAVPAPNSLLARASELNGAVKLPDDYNRRDVHAAEIGSANAITNARSLARLYAALIGPVEGGPDRAVLSRAQIEAAREQQTHGPDRVLSVNGLSSVKPTFGLGFIVSSATSPFGGAKAFGHGGVGGSFGIADPEHGLACGYVTNQMANPASRDPRGIALIRASYEAAARRSDSYRAV